MNTYFSQFDWYDFFRNGDIHEVTAKFTNYVLDIAKLFIPFGFKMIRKSSHPWLNEKCKRLVLQKHTAFGTPNYEKERDKCSKGLFEEYLKHVDNTKSWLETNAKSQKSWWHYSKTLLLRQKESSIIPALQKTDESWAFTGVDKSNLMAEEFASKGKLPERCINEYSSKLDYGEVATV